MNTEKKRNKFLDTFFKCFQGKGKTSNENSSELKELLNGEEQE